MGSNMKVLAGLAGIAVLCASAASADTDLDTQLNDMQTQIQALQDRLDAEEPAIPGLEGRESSSAFAIPGGEFFGWVAGSYSYSPTNNESDLTGFAIYNGAHQGALDEIWLGVDGTGDGSNTAGYFFEMTIGHTGSQLGSSFSFTDDNGDTGASAIGGGQGIFVPNAYVQWNTDLVTLDLGKFGTTVGYEVAGANNHPNITLGQLWGQQSVDLAGARLSTDLGDAIAVTGGVVNGTAVDLTETGDAPAVFWGLGVDIGDDAFVSFNGTWEDDPSAPGGPIDLTVLDVVATLEATEDLHVWANFDYLIDNLEGGMDIWGVAGGAVLGVTDTMTTALRGEFLDFDGGAQTYSVTGTIGCNVTDNLNVAFEVRWDGSDEDVFNTSDDVAGDPSDNQVVGVLRTTFTF